MSMFSSVFRLHISEIVT